MKNGLVKPFPCAYDELKHHRFFVVIIPRGVVGVDMALYFDRERVKHDFNTLEY